ncbi:MAG: acyl carrier protein [Lachnospiraceae bacterium]|nr:acyl carrier protein [Lachnospiraceae bacterium]
MEFEKVKEIVAKVLNLDPEEITPEKSFMEDLEADSLDLAEIIVSIEEEFGVSVPDETLEKIVTVQDACDFVTQWFATH